MNNKIPGKVKYREREYIYIQTRHGDSFLRIAESVASQDKIAMPKSGGIVEERTKAKLPDGRELIALSYHGDITGWRTLYTQFCIADGRIFGFVESSGIVLSDGGQFALDDVDFIFER